MYVCSIQNVAIKKRVRTFESLFSSFTTQQEMKSPKDIFENVFLKAQFPCIIEEKN